MGKKFRNDSPASFRERVKELILARTPLFYMGSIEIKRCLDEIKIVAYGVKAEVKVFRLAQGILDSDEEKTAADPITVLDTILKDRKYVNPEKQTVWVLPFFHLLLQTPDAMIISKLREIVEFSKFRATVIITGVPNFQLPPELEDIPILNLPLLNFAEIESLLGPNLDMEEKAQIAKKCLGFQTREIEDLFSISLVRRGHLDPAMIETLRSETIQTKNHGLLEIEFPKERLDQVGGMGALKGWLSCRKEALLDPKAYKKWNLPAPKGVLLLGVPGCGKSLLCKAIPGSWNIPLLRVDSSRIYSSSVGSSEKNFFRSLELARMASPCVLWIDEIEKSFAITDSRTDGGVSSRLLGTLLHFLQERDSPIFVIGTSNDLNSIPSEMLRKGRWDEIFFIDLPSWDERCSIFEALLRKYGYDLAVDEDLLFRSEGFSGAEIEQTLVEAAYDSLFHKIPLSAFTIRRHLGKIIPLSYFVEERITAMRNWARGHARLANADHSTSKASSKPISFRPRKDRLM